MTCTLCVWGKHVRSPAHEAALVYWTSAAAAECGFQTCSFRSPCFLEGRRCRSESNRAPPADGNSVEHLRRRRSRASSRCCFFFFLYSSNPATAWLWFLQKTSEQRVGGGRTDSCTRTHFWSPKLADSQALSTWEQHVQKFVLGSPPHRNGFGSH